MRSTLLLALLVVSTAAAPFEVEMVQPRRVSTSSSADFTPRRPLGIDLDDLLRSFGLGAGGFGGSRPRGRIPMLLPRLPASSCDSARFRLTEEQFDVVSACQRQQQQTLRQCILSGIEDGPATELRDFLDRDEYTVAGVSVKYAISLVDDEVTSVRDVTFRMCPRDEANTVDNQGDDSEEVDRTDADQDTTVYRPRPTFQFPDLFSDQSPFDFNFETALRPFFEGGSRGIFPSFPDLDFDTDEEDSSCVQESFNLPRDAFKAAKRCRYGDEPFKQCLRRSLESEEQAKELLKFVEGDSHQIVDTGFYQSLAAVNGQITRKYTVSLERCAREESREEQGDVDTPEETAYTPEDTPDTEEAAPDSEPELKPDTEPELDQTNNAVLEP